MKKMTAGERIVTKMLEYSVKELRTSPRCRTLRAIAEAIDSEIEKTRLAVLEKCADTCETQQACTELNPSPGRERHTLEPFRGGGRHAGMTYAKEFRSWKEKPEGGVC